MRSRSAGDCDFPRDPNSPADPSSLFWIPSLQPEAVLVNIADKTIESAAMTPINIPHLPGVSVRQAVDGWHAIWPHNDTAHLFWLSENPRGSAAHYTVTLPLDAFFELRLHAALRLWRALSGRAPGPPFRIMPDQLRQLHVLTLRALDARLEGASYRTIAEILLGFRGSKTDWENDPRKNKARRLAAAGKRMMLGGYRALLHYPIKLHRR